MSGGYFFDPNVGDVLQSRLAFTQTTPLSFQAAYSLDTSTASGHTTNTYVNTGANFVVGDLLFLQGGSYYEQAIMVVTGIDGNGRPNAIRVYQAGEYKSVPSTPVSTTTNSKNGTGTITLQPVWVSSLSGTPNNLANNAQQMGMVDDGLTATPTNNTPLLNAAIAACAAGGYNYLFVPPGTYNFILSGSPSVQLPQDFALVAYPGTVTFLIDPTSWAGVGSGVTLTFINVASGDTVRGLVVDGQKAAVNGGFPGIVQLNAFNRTTNSDVGVIFEDTTVQNSPGSNSTEAFTYACGYSSDSWFFTRAHSLNNYTSGISINGDMPTQISSGGASGAPTNIHITDCKGIGNSWQGMTCYAAGSASGPVVISNFVGNGNGTSSVGLGHGINIEWSQYITILNPFCTLNYGAGIGGFGWNDNLFIDNPNLIANNQGDIATEGEIAFNRGSWYTAGFAPAANRNNLYGVLQNLTITNANNVVPKSTGNYCNHIHVSSDYATSYPAATNSQPVSIHISGKNVSSWRASGLGADVYCYSSSVNGGEWLPNTTYSIGNTRHNAGWLFTCTTGGTSNNGLGPTATSPGQTGITDGAAVWTATSAAVDAIAQGSFWGAATAYAWNDIRCNNGYAYRVVIPNSVGATGTSGALGSANGPQGTTVGGTETDGTLTWACQGQAMTSTLSIGSNAPKANDAWQTGYVIGELSSFSPSANTQVANWTASSVTIAAYTGGGDLSGLGVTLTASGAGSNNATVNVQDAKWLPGGQSFVAVARYKQLSGDTGWHFCMRPVGVFSTANAYGTSQFDAQLSSPIGDTSNWYVAYIPFVIPAASSAAPTIYYSGAKTAASIVIDSVDVVPLQEFNLRGSEVSLGGRAIYYGNTPTNRDIDVGDRLLNSTQGAPDQVCTTAGSYGALNGATTLTMGTSTSTGTLSQIDPTYRPGMWLNVPGAGTSGTSKLMRLRYVNGTSVIFNTSTSSSSAVSAVSPTIQAPVFTSLTAANQAPTISGAIVAHAGGGQASATALVVGLNNVVTVATSGDSVQFPAAIPPWTLNLANNGANPMNVYPANGRSDKINALAANTALSVGSTSAIIAWCTVAGQIQTK